MSEKVQLGQKLNIIQTVVSFFSLEDLLKFSALDSKQLKIVFNLIKIGLEHLISNTYNDVTQSILNNGNKFDKNYVKLIQNKLLAYVQRLVKEINTIQIKELFESEIAFHLVSKHISGDIHDNFLQKFINQHKFSLEGQYKQSGNHEMKFMDVKFDGQTFSAKGYDSVDQFTIKGVISDTMEVKIDKRQINRGFGWLQKGQLKNLEINGQQYDHDERNRYNQFYLRIIIVKN